MKGEHSPFLYFAWIPLMLGLILTGLIIIRLVLSYVSKFISGYGRLLDLCDNILETNLTPSGRKSCIVATLELDEDMCLQEVRKLFEERVLNAPLDTGGKDKRLRYPKLKQYITTLCGFPIWKNVANFQMSDHITEDEVDVRRLNLGLIHERLLNKRFRDQMSPWEIIVYRNVIFVDETGESFSGNPKPKTIVAFRAHHAMADARSVVKMFVECVGQKKLNTPEPKFEERSIFRKFLYPIFFPLHVVRIISLGVSSLIINPSHQWKVEVEDDQDFVVRFSKPLNIQNLKNIAKSANVTVSAVIIYLIAEAMREYDKSMIIDGSLLTYVLPKPNHPSSMTNHFSGGMGYIPRIRKSVCLMDRLTIYYEYFNALKNSEHCSAIDFLGKLPGILPSGRLKNTLGCNYLSPVGITNIAGDRKGFYFGNAWCSGFRISASAPRGCTGMVFCPFSYQTHLHIALVGRLSDTEVEKVVNLIDREYDEASQTSLIQPVNLS